MQICLLAGLLPLVSCQNYEPELISRKYRLELVGEADGTSHERLRIFFLSSDRDGIGDIDALHIACDRLQLLWKLEGDTLVRIQQGDLQWVGSSALVMPDASPLPRQKYRAVLIDRAFKRDETSFSLSRELVCDPDLLPRFVQGDEGAAVELAGGAGEWMRGRWNFYSADDKLIEYHNAELERQISLPPFEQEFSYARFSVERRSGGCTYISAPVDRRLFGE